MRPIDADELKITLTNCSTGGCDTCKVMQRGEQDGRFNQQTGGD